MKRLCMPCWLHQSELLGGWSVSSNRNLGTQQIESSLADALLIPVTHPLPPSPKQMLLEACRARRTSDTPCAPPQVEDCGS